MAQSNYKIFGTLQQIINLMITLKLEALLIMCALVSLGRANEEEEEQDQVAYEGITLPDEIDESLILGSGGIDNIKWDFAFPEESFTSWNYDDYLSANLDIFGSEDIPDLWKQDAEEAFDFSIPSEFNITFPSDPIEPTIKCSSQCSKNGKCQKINVTQPFCECNQSFFGIDCSITETEYKKKNKEANIILNQIIVDSPAKNCTGQSKNYVKLAKVAKDFLNSDNQQLILKAASQNLQSTLGFCAVGDINNMINAMSSLMGQRFNDKASLMEGLRQAYKEIGKWLIQSNDTKKYTISSPNLVGIIQEVNISKKIVVPIGQMPNPYDTSVQLPQATITIDKDATSIPAARLLRSVVQNCEHTELTDCESGPLLDITFMDNAGDDIKNVQFNSDKQVLLTLPLYKPSITSPKLYIKYWDEKTGEYKSDGCQSASMLGQQIKTKCSHFTLFAISTKGAPEASVSVDSSGQGLTPKAQDDGFSQLLIISIILIVIIAS